MAPFIILFIIDPVNRGSVYVVRIILDVVIILPYIAEHIYGVPDIDAAADLGAAVFTAYKYVRAVLVDNIDLSVRDSEINYSRIAVVVTVSVAVAGERDREVVSLGIDEKRLGIVLHLKTFVSRTFGFVLSLTSKVTIFMPS